MLADIVSKNGNLLLNIPVRGDGTIDEKELAVVEGIADWMGANKEAIFGTRPVEIYRRRPGVGRGGVKRARFQRGQGQAHDGGGFSFHGEGPGDLRH